MITFVYPVHPEKGYRLDLSCPAILCDVCKGLIDSAHPGNLLWRSANDEDCWHVHQGTCDRRLERTVGEPLLSRELDKWLANLVHNYTEPLIGGTAELDSGDTFPITAVKTKAADTEG